MSDVSVEAGGDVIWTPQEGPQRKFVQCPFEEVLYGGAAGGGKSDALLGDFASGIEQYGSAWVGILVRRSFPQLEELERRSLELFGPHYGVDSYKSGKRIWYLKSQNKGTAVLYMRAIEEDKDVQKIQGFQYNWIGIDELTHFPSDYVLNYLITRRRAPKGAPKYVRCTTNPGSVGHSWVKSRWRIGEVDPMVPFDVSRPGSKSPYRRIFIPAKLTDNKILMENDPDYADVLNDIDNPILRRALRDGDWDITQGAAFPEFDKNVHVVDNHEVPDGLQVWRSLDWGYSAPFACVWFYADFDGNVNVCAEFYGMGAKLDSGVQMDPEEVAGRIAKVEQLYGWNVKEAYLDPQCWAVHGGPSIFEQLGGYKMRWQPWSKEHNWRTNKKSMLHGYLKVVNGKARLTFQRRCQHTIRTLNGLQLDLTNPEVVDKRGPDHFYDALCGGLAKNVPTKAQNLRRQAREWDSEWEREGAHATKSRFGGW